MGHLKYLSDVNNFTHYYSFSIFIKMNTDFAVEIGSQSRLEECSETAIKAENIIEVEIAVFAQN